MDEHKKINISYEASGSEDRTDRIEMLWTDRLNIQLKSWLNECLTTAKKHNAAGKKSKYLYRCLGIPASIIPLVIGIMGNYIPPEGAIVISMFLALASVLNATNVALNYGQLQQKHYNSEYEYNRLILKIKYILAQPKRNRVASDVIMTEIRLELASIAKAAPDI